MKTDKVYLVGFMATGKTSVARALGRRLGWQVCDVDEAIETREHRSVADIFAKSGEPYFRTVEREVLIGFLPLRPAVVATGGGTFVDPQTRAVINADGMSVWLDVPIEELIARVPADGRRPLAATRDQFERLFWMRQVAYEQAHLRVDAAGLPVKAVVERILDWLEY